jgi:arginine decarboxylase
MDINLTSGKGTGPTPLAAYDAALFEAGFEHNIIYLSSIIPEGCKVIKGGPGYKVPGTYGDRVYAVVAHHQTDKPNTEVWAGLGWVQDKATGKGLFVEHHADSKEAIEQDIAQSLTRLIEIREREYGPIQMLVEGITCIDQPVSTIVAAIFKSEPWN